MSQRQLLKPADPTTCEHVFVDTVCMRCGARKTGKTPEAPEQPKKFDNGKLRIELVPPELIEGAARVLGFGAEKYSAGNWAKGDGFDHSRLYGGLQRHLNSYWKGEDHDPESGHLHLEHAACMLAFLLAHVKRGHGNDDRVAVGVKVAPK